MDKEKFYVPNPLKSLAMNRTGVKVIVTNGYQMHGEVIAWSDDCIVLSVDGRQQIVYIQNISTIIPDGAVEI